jgi:hypothetical protein
MIGPTRRGDKRVKISELKIKETQIRINAVMRCKQQTYDVEILDIGRGGLRFSSKEPFKKGVKLMFELHIINAESSLPMELPLAIGAKLINDYGINKHNEHEYGVLFPPFVYWHERLRIEKMVYTSAHKTEPKIDYNELYRFKDDSSS